MQVTAPIGRAQLTAELLDNLMGVGRRFRRPSADGMVYAGSFWLLKSLLGGGPVRPTDLAASMGLDISTISRHLAQLHRAGLVERSVDPDDRRAQLVQLTPTGRTAVDAALASRRALLERGLSSWADDDVEQLHRLITRMLVSLESAEEGPQGR
ncbi:MAG TPA: MarR family winged helix-turn-helix transcriptional regulator [Propionibacteriaceae bacterium]|jgi:DNA-binding MarR family transcriptional regulator|nr:MarR family winged helix-turn-helix transcriptional regulator [Propionibacteriaceae bacterium]